MARRPVIDEVAQAGVAGEVLREQGDCAARVDEMLLPGEVTGPRRAGLMGSAGPETIVLCRASALLAARAWPAPRAPVIGDGGVDDDPAGDEECASSAQA